MSTYLFIAREYIIRAQAALQRGDPSTAWQLGIRAARVAPGMEDAWLVLAASDPNPQNAIAHAQQALAIHPNSRRARTVLEWAMHRATQTRAQNAQRNWTYLTVLLAFGCFIAGFIGLFVFTHPALAAIVSPMNGPASPGQNLWAPMQVAKPTVTPPATATSAPPVADPPTVQPVEQGSPGEPAPQEQDHSLSDSDRWIDVNLSEQRVDAYEGDVVVNSFLVSTGVASSPTVTGNFQIYVKVPIQDMSGPGYHLTDVPWVMFFYEDYGFHGTYWHNNFGTPMSRGCVNLTIDDAAWLYEWASVGTPVYVHY